MYLTKCRCVTSFFFFLLFVFLVFFFESRAHRRVQLHPTDGPPYVFQQGRHDEQTGNALAQRADEGRGIPAISVGEP